MDIKTKSKSWVGNIYHQFEAICQDVDDFMSKETVRYVENQEQNVGASVKHLYTHVLQDKLPPPGDKVEAKSESVPDNPFDIRESLLDPVPIGSLRNSNASSQIELDPKMQFVDSFFLSPSQNAKHNLRVWDDGDSVIWSDANSSYEENMNEYLMPQTVISYEARKDSDDIGVEKERASCTHFSDDLESLSITSRLTIVQDLDSVENTSLSPLLDKAHAENSFKMGPAYSSVCEAGPLGEGGTLSDTVSTKDESFDVPSSVQSPNLVFSYFSCKDEETHMAVISSNCLSKKFSETEPAQSITTQLVDNPSCTSLESEDGANVSTLSSAIEAGETIDIDKPDNNVSTTHGLFSEVASSETKHEQCHGSALPNFPTSASETGSSDGFGVGAAGVDMETADLSPEVKPDGTSVPNINLVHAPSHRRRNFRYYKKLIQDAFSSRKRLFKEYEHLGIIYGDIDTESGRYFEPNSLASSTAISVQAGRTSPFHEPHDSEWELL